MKTIGVLWRGATNEGTYHGWANFAFRKLRIFYLKNFRILFFIFSQPWYLYEEELLIRVIYFGKVVVMKPLFSIFVDFYFSQMSE